MPRLVWYLAAPLLGLPQLRAHAAMLQLLAREAQGPAIRQQLVSLRNWAPGGATAAAAGAACWRGAGSLPAGSGAAAGQWRSMWGEPPTREEVMHRDSFYDNVRAIGSELGAAGWGR